MKAAAALRLEDLRQDAITYLHSLLNQKDYPSAGLGAANSVLDRVDGKAHESVEMTVNINETELLQRLARGRLRNAEGA